MVEFLMYYIKVLQTFIFHDGHLFVLNPDVKLQNIRKVWDWGPHYFSDLMLSSIADL